MRVSRYMLPTVKENPADAQIISHRFMLRAGMIRQSTAGIYSWLPLGLKVLRKIEDIVRRQQEAVGCVELLMPTIQPADIWRESGRYEAYGPEMLRLRDRHDRELLYGPTNEELIAVLFRETVRSYKQLPKLLYQIQWKFRDEIRPRFGVMRGREFLMKDAYSFDLDKQSALHSYHKMFIAYLRTFQCLGLKAIPMRADTGPIGGDLSHEFVILADTGESEISYHRDFMDLRLAEAEIDLNGDLSGIVDQFTQKYAATDERRDSQIEDELGEDVIRGRGIEVGHIFSFGRKYSLPMKVCVAGASGEDLPVEMGSYGIGVSRLVGAIIEASHDDAGIIWPDSVAPFSVGLINLKADDSNSASLADEIYAVLRSRAVDVLYDDRDERAGVKFSEMDLIGIPTQAIIGPRGARSGTIEIKDRRTGERHELSMESAIARLLERSKP